MTWLFLPLMYLFGSVPFGLLIGFLGGRDIRKEGSGNIGFTNVFRVCGAAWGIPVLLLDMLKGYLPLVLLAPALIDASDPRATLLLVLGGVCAILGHTFPVWLRFRGGKGVATSAAVILALMPYPFLLGLGVFLLVFALFRYISLASMTSSLAVLVAQILIADAPFSPGQRPVTILAGVIFVLILILHRSNIGRLLRGEENRLGARKPSSTTGDVADATAHPTPNAAQQTDANPAPTSHIEDHIGASIDANTNANTNANHEGGTKGNGEAHV